MHDLISRQAAIDALHMHLMYRMGTIKKQPPMEKFLPCTCGRNSRSRWWGVHKDDAVIVECRGCGRRVCAKNERELRKKWNAVMRGETNEVD